MSRAKAKLITLLVAFDAPMLPGRLLAEEPPQPETVRQAMAYLRAELDEIERDLLPQEGPSR